MEARELPSPGPEDRLLELDAGFASALSSFSQRLSRRNMLRRAGAVAVAAFGISALKEVVPGVRGLARANGQKSGLGYAPASEWGNCSSWDRCNMCGYSCNCCNGSQGAGACPDCAVKANYWTGCCAEDGVARRWLVRYWDCKSVSCSDNKIRDCYNCTGCNNGCPESFWKGNGWYVCTTVNVIQTC